MKKQLNKQHVEIPSHLKRVNYFNGQFLSQTDLTTEQTYIIDRGRLHNLHIHGYGIVSGLAVSVPKNLTDVLIVSPGVAIDPQGNEIFLPAVVAVPVPKKGDFARLMLYWSERETDFVPVPSSTGEGGGMAASRIEEYAILNVEAEEATLKPNGIMLARLKKFRGVWRVDKKFRVRHVK